jgi:hypothetical protein
MSRQQPQARLGATPGKLALIGVLAVVLIGVIASNWPSAAPASDEVAGETTDVSPMFNSVADALAATPGAPAPGDPFGEFASDADWPELPLKEVTRHDPFAAAAWAVRPDALDEAEEEYSEEQINELLSAQNAIILMTGDRRIARIGSQEFEVGDVYGHFKIVEISARGVVLSEAE